MSHPTRVSSVESAYAHGRPELGVRLQLRMHERRGREPRHVHAAIERAEALQCSPDQGRAWVQVACRWRAGGVQGIGIVVAQGMGARARAEGRPRQGPPAPQAATAATAAAAVYSSRSRHSGAAGARDGVSASGQLLHPGGGAESTACLRVGLGRRSSSRSSTLGALGERARRASHLLVDRPQIHAPG